MIQRFARRALRIPFPAPRRALAHTFEALEPRQLWSATAAPEEVLFQDVGVGGGELFNVSEPLYV